MEFAKPFDAVDAVIDASRTKLVFAPASGFARAITTAGQPLRRTRL